MRGKRSLLLAGLLAVMQLTGCGTTSDAAVRPAEYEQMSGLNSPITGVIEFGESGSDAASETGTPEPSGEGTLQQAEGEGQGNSDQGDSNGGRQ